MTDLPSDSEASEANEPHATLVRPEDERREALRTWVIAAQREIAIRAGLFEPRNDLERLWLRAGLLRPSDLDCVRQAFRWESPWTGGVAR